MEPQHIPSMVGGDKQGHWNENISLRVGTLVPFFLSSFVQCCHPSQVGGFTLTGTFPGCSPFVTMHYDDNHCYKIKEHACNNHCCNLFKKSLIVKPFKEEKCHFPRYRAHSVAPVLWLQQQVKLCHFKFFVVLIKITLSNTRVKRVRTIKTFKI